MCLQKRYTQYNSLLLLPYTSQNRLFQCFLEWHFVTNECARAWAIIGASACSRFAIIKFAKWNNPLTAREV